jgi:PiT family inorganic phosphate transporter
MDLNIVLTAVALILGFYMAWNIGANDVANAMGTSVGSKALTLKRAVFLAAILEFSGAFFVGSNVSLTIQKGIIDPQIFSADPMIFVLGMLGSLLATGVLLQIASYFGLPISTTHAIVGAVIGFGAAVGGLDAVRWSEVGWIGASWVVSPLLSGIFAYLLYLLIRKKILHAPNPIEATQRLAPFFVFLCFQIVSLSLLYNGLPQFDLNFSLLESLSLSSTVSLSAAFISYRWMKGSPALAPVLESGFFEEDIAKTRRGIEKTFIFLQIMSACLVAFAHGANDVANAIGPVAAVLGVLKTHSIATHSQVPPWLLALGGAGIVIGLATWGWRVIETVGSKITELTPTRGFAAELGAAITILFASKLGLPISTTHALVGAVLGVGMVRGLRAINLQTLREIVISWLVTIPLCAGLSVAMFYLLKWVLL